MNMLEIIMKEFEMRRNIGSVLSAEHCLSQCTLGVITRWGPCCCLLDNCKLKKGDTNTNDFVQ